MTTKKLILAAIALVILGGGVFSLSQKNGTMPQNPTPTPTQQAQPTTMQQESASSSTMEKEGNTIIYNTDSGYAPAILTVKSGTTVTFKNESGSPMWTATGLHPTHRIYPGSDIAKCGTAEQSKIFDACKGYEKGESWPFTFNEKGTWKYHNHLRVSYTGTIVVE